MDGTTIRNTLAKNDSHWDAGKDSFHYPEDYRLEILAQAMDGFVRQHHSGVHQQDFASRKLMLVANTKPTAEVLIKGGLPLRRIVLVDYSKAMVYRLTKAGRDPVEDLPLPWYVFLDIILPTLGENLQFTNPRAW